MDVHGGKVQPLGLDSEASGPAAVATNLTGLDEILTHLVTKFFEDYSLPPNAQKRLLKNFEDLFIFNIRGLKEYSRNSPEDFKTVFGAFAPYCFQQTRSEGDAPLHQNDPSGQGGLGRDVLEYFKVNSDSNRSVSSARDNILTLASVPEPFDISGVDLSLLHPVFGSFVRDFREMQPQNHEWGNVKILFRLVRNPSRTWSTQGILEALERLLCVKLISPYPASLGKLRISGAYCTEIRDLKELPVVLVVIKNSGDTRMTGITFYHHCLGDGLLNRLYSVWREYFNRSCCPCFMIEIQGCQMRVSGLAMLTKVTCTSFTHLLNLYGDPNDAWEVIRAFQALKKAIIGLRRFTENVTLTQWERLPQSWGFLGTEFGERTPWGYVLSRRSLRPYPLEKYSNVRQLVSGSYTYVVDSRFVVKYVRRYSQEVHRAWATIKLAPELISVEPLPGGYLEVTMEYLSSPWMQLNVRPSEEECLAVLTGLETAHRVPVTICDQIGFGVHGDARPDNVMINGTTKEVMFIDFQLSGLDEMSYYPHDLCETKFWPFKNSSNPVKLLREHDKSYYLADSGYRASLEKTPFRRRVEESLANIAEESSRRQALRFS